MLRELAALSLRFRVLVLGVVAAVLGVGMFQLHGAAVDTLPEFAPPQVRVQAEALGLSAAEVEQLVTVPLEQDLLNGVPWLDSITSESVPGLSTIDMVFKRGTNILRARQLVSEHLTQAHALPQVGTPPVMVQPTSSASRVLMVALHAKNLSLIDLSVLARWKIKPRLLGVSGVANVSIWGQRDRQLQVQVDPDKLEKYGITLNQVVDTTGNALVVSSLTFVEASTPGTGGFIDTPSQRLAIQHTFPITTAKGLAGVSVEDSHGEVVLGQVANVVEDHQPLIGDAVLGNDPGLMLVIDKFPNADTRDVTADLERALSQMAPGLSGVTIDTGIYRPASYLNRALRNVGIWLLGGLVLLLLVVGLFTGSIRVALVAALSTATSVVAAAWILYLRDTPFNVLILAGVLVAVGVCVVGVVADVDRIRNRLHADQDETSSDEQVVVDASWSVRGPQMYAALIAVIVPLPLSALTGIGGALSRAFVLSYVLAVAVSTVVAVLATPALALVFVGRPRRPPDAAPVVRVVHRAFDRLAPMMMAKPRLAYVVALGLAAIGLTLIPQLGARATLPSFRDHGVLVQWRAAPGTSLTEITRLVDLAGTELRALPGVAELGSHAGRALLSDQIGNVNTAETWLTLRSSADYQDTLRAVRQVSAGYPGITSTVTTYPESRISAVADLDPSNFVVRVYGTDLHTLQSTAYTVAKMLGGVRGVVAPTVEQVPEEPTVQVRVNLTAAQKYAVTPGEVRRAAATFFAGLPVGSLYENAKIFDVVVWGTPSVRYTPATVADLRIDIPGGDQIRLRDVASVTIAPAATVIKHNGIFRTLDITAHVTGRSAHDVARDVRDRLQAMPMPLEYHAEVMDNLGAHSSSVDHVVAWYAAVLAGIFLLIQAAFGSWRLATAFFLSLPVALVGAVAAAWPVGGVRSLGGLLGVLIVFVLTVGNGLMLLCSYQQGGDQPGTGPAGASASARAELVLARTRERVGPVLLSGLVLAAVMLPLLLLGRVEGTEAFYPAASTVLGGIVSSTLVTLIVLPVLYLRFGRHRGDPFEPEPTPTPMAGTTAATAGGALVGGSGTRTARPGVGRSGGRRFFAGLIAGALAATVLSGCSGSDEPSAEETPAWLGSTGTYGTPQVHLTGEAARRIDLTTEPVLDLGHGTRSVPVASVVYDKNGGSWVYVAVQPLEFEREPVLVDSITGDTARFTDGPVAKAPVVTVGAAELLGTEFVVSGE